MRPEPVRSLRIPGRSPLHARVGRAQRAESNRLSIAALRHAAVAVATLTTSSLLDPELTIEGAELEVSTILYVLVAIGIVVGGNSAFRPRRSKSGWAKAKDVRTTT